MQQNTISCDRQGALVSRGLCRFALFAAILISGCAATPGPRALLATPVTVKTVDGAATIKDGRARFRTVFCSILRAKGQATPKDASCERWLWRLPDEPDLTDTGLGVAPAPESLAIFLVTGAFSECVGAEARPFSVGAARLREAGAMVETVVVSGRSGSDHNARQIADALERAQLGGERTVILIGFSKGALDILHLLVNFPDTAQQVDAVVSVASPVYGSRLADKADAPYSALLARFPHSTCAPGDGQIFSSLRTDTTTQWLVVKALPTDVRYYSIGAFTTREHVARGLVPSWTYLNTIDPRNDGQIIARDAVIPGATLLGYANADHWGIASTIESVHTFLGARPDATRFPQKTLFDAIVQFVTEDLAGDSEGHR